VSVVVACFRQAEFVGEVIRSLRAQSDDRWELLIAVDGSPDDSAAKARLAADGDERVRVLELAHAGVGRARNAGLEASDAGSEYVAFVDADDCLEPSMLERMSAWLDQHPLAPAVHCLTTLIDERGDELVDVPPLAPRLVPDGSGVRTLPNTEATTPFDAVLALAGIIPSAVMIRRTALQVAGGYDEGFGQGFEDTDLMLRLALIAPLGFVAEPLVRYRRHAACSSSVPGRHERQWEKLEARWRDVSGRSYSESALITRAWRFHDRQLCPARAPRRRASACGEAGRSRPHASSSAPCGSPRGRW
jgi:glycosyltransferase involved in cell wall biosynthesis